MNDILRKCLKHPMLVNEAFERGITEECKRLTDEGFLEFRYSRISAMWALTLKGLDYLKLRGEEL